MKYRLHFLICTGAAITFDIQVETKHFSAEHVCDEAGEKLAASMKLTYIFSEPVDEV